MMETWKVKGLNSRYKKGLKCYPRLSPAHFISSYIEEGNKTISEYWGYIFNLIHSPNAIDPLKHLMDTWGVGVGF